MNEINKKGLKNFLSHSLFVLSGIGAYIAMLYVPQKERKLAFYVMIVVVILCFLIAYKVGAISFSG